MTDRDIIGPRLRRLREQRGISLEAIAAATKVDVELWSAMERNDFSRWPSGVFARAFVREYARRIGANPEETVNEFCRWFPKGDRRRGRIIREKAEFLGISTQWSDDQAPRVSNDRRRPLMMDGSIDAAASASGARPWRMWAMVAAFAAATLFRWRRTASQPAVTK